METSPNKTLVIDSFPMVYDDDDRRYTTTTTVVETTEYLADDGPAVRVGYFERQCTKIAWRESLPLDLRVTFERGVPGHRDR